MEKLLPVNEIWDMLEKINYTAESKAETLKYITNLQEDIRELKYVIKDIKNTVSEVNLS